MVKLIGMDRFSASINLTFLGSAYLFLNKGEEK